MSTRRIVCLAVLSATSAIGCTTSRPTRLEPTTTFVGSSACRACHQAIYDRWQTTLMANVVQDPKQHPKAIVADFSTPNPLVTFKPEDVDFTYGTKWKQRYFQKVGDDYFPTGFVPNLRFGSSALVSHRKPETPLPSSGAWILLPTIRLA